MVRTKADGAVKAVAAKAPRKNQGGSSSSYSLSADIGSPSGKAGKYAGGNPYQPRPKPSWQKGIQGFLKPKSDGFPTETNGNSGNKESDSPPRVEGTNTDGSASSNSHRSTSPSTSAKDRSPLRRPVISDNEDD